MAEFPSDEDYLKRYAQIGKRAEEAIWADQVGDNPILTGALKEARYSLATLGLIYNSPAGLYLTRSVKALQKAYPQAQYIPPELLHLTLGEVFYQTCGRPPKGVFERLVNNYYPALRDNFPQNSQPINLELCTIIPALDAPFYEGALPSVAVVAGFLNHGYHTLFKVRQEIQEAVKKAGLEPSSRISNPSIIFATLGRLITPPIGNLGQKKAFLDTLENLNRELPRNLNTKIGEINLISTTKHFYHYAGTQLFMWPPIALQAENQKIDDLLNQGWQVGGVRVIRASLRRRLPIS